jgi:transcriptional regulator with GAF, ATPase, and Fis domain
VSRDPIAEVLEGLGHNAGEDSLVAAEELLRVQPTVAGRILDGLLPALARVQKGEVAARVALVLGSAYLARKDATHARELLLEGLDLLGAASPPVAARGALRLATAELALGNVAAARAGLARSLEALLDLGDDALLDELAGDLRAVKDDLAARVVQRLGRERRERGGESRSGNRLEVVARLVRALNSGAAGTAEPLYAILRAILAETGAGRGFILLYEAAALRFEVGLDREGRTLGAESFQLSTTVVDRTLETGRCLLVPDIAATLLHEEAQSARELGLRAALCAPLRVERKRPGVSRAATLPSVRGVAGVLYVDSTAAGSFGEADARFFEVLADCAVLAVRAARTKTEVERTAPPKGAARALAPAPAAPDATFPELVTRARPMLDLVASLGRVAASDANVLIRGESGTGKELVARAIHRTGPRGRAPFVVVDCGALNDELVAAELFGHEAGAFTGAQTARAGLLERADGGTLFLDEIGEMSPALQAAILRAVQEGEVRRLGGQAPRRVSVRILAATHRDVRAMVERGELRQDLLYRIAAVELRVPPLREREGDVALLVAHFLEKLGAGKSALAIEPEALERLEEHAWPGNVRELENVLAAASVLGSGTITLADVDRVLSESPAVILAPPAATEEGDTLEALEKRAIADRLERFGWNQVQAAKSLGLDRGTLRRKILRYGIVRGRG